MTDVRMVYIMRGIPGSGKTRFARSITLETYVPVIFSADDYFTKDGRYIHDVSKLDMAHGQCFRGFLEAIQEHDDPFIIVDNTNLSAWECSPYVLAAKSYGYEVEVYNIHCNEDVAYKRQKHGVPMHLHHAMMSRMVTERLPPFWTVRDVPEDL